MQRSLSGTAWAAATVVLLLLPAQARSQSRSRETSFDYYLLSLSYAPDFCAEPGGNKDARECGNGRKVGFIVHGLWPQGNGGRGPERCGSARPVSSEIVRTMLPYMLIEGLIQHEWTNHGTCSGLSAADYFAAIRKARDSVAIPEDLKQPGGEIHLSPAQIEGKFAAANPRFPKEAFRASCYRDGELQEARVCFDKDLSPRACGASAGTCSTSSVTMLPVH